MLRKKCQTCNVPTDKEKMLSNIYFFNPELERAVIIMENLLRW
jgi:hypothetical protein